MTTLPPAPVPLVCGHKESHTGKGYQCTERGEHSHHIAKDPDGNALLTWPNSDMPPVGSVVVCTEHRGAHVATVVHHFSNGALGVAWGLSCIYENRVHAKDAASCPADRVRVCAEEDLPGGDFQRSDLNFMRAAAYNLVRPSDRTPEPAPPSPGLMETRHRQRAAQARHQARRLASGSAERPQGDLS